MFSEWLFPAALIVKPGYEVGRAEAISCLCRIFSYLQRTEQFYTHYLQQFYSTLSQALSGDFLALQAVIRNSCHLFSLPLEGFRLLTPDYIKGLARIIPVVQASTADYHGQKLDSDLLKKIGYKIIGNIAFSLNAYKSVGIHIPPSEIEINNYIDVGVKQKVDFLYPLPEQHTFYSLKPKIVSMLLNSIIIEQNPKNCKILFNLISSYVAHEAKFNPSILHIFTIVIQDMISIPDYWSADIVMAAFDVLSFFCAIANTNELGFSSCAKELCRTLCQYLIYCLKSDTLVPLQARISRAYELLSKWALAGDWLLTNLNLQKLIISTLSRGVAILDRDHIFGAVEAVSEHHLKSSSLGLSSVNISGKGIDSNKMDTTMSNHSQSNTQGLTQGSPAAARAKKVQNARMSLAPPKRFQNARKSYQINASGVSTGAKDGGVGLPSFAILSSEIQIKGAAETALSLLNLRLGNYPSNRSIFGVTRLSSGWKEAKYQQELIDLRRKAGVEMDAIGAKAGVRYFSFQKRIILGLIESPDWGKFDPEHGEPSLIVTMRDSSGNFSWVGEFKYVEKLSKENPKLVANPRSPTGTTIVLQSPILSARDHTAVFGIGKNYAPEKIHFRPEQNPRLPESAKPIQRKAANEKNIPDILECTQDKDELADTLELMESYIKMENKLSSSPNGSPSAKAAPHSKVDTLDPKSMYGFNLY
jgi:hypothetical protein